MARYSLISVLTIGWLVFGSGPFLGAQNNRQSPPRQSRNGLVTPVGKRPRNPAQQQPISRELALLLDEWETHSSKVKTLEGKHTRITYDTVFFVAKRSHGKFFYETPDKGRIDLIGDKSIRKGDKLGRPNPKTGKQQVFALLPDRSEMWICDGVNITQVDVDAKQGSRYNIPPAQRGANIIEGPLPFVFGMKAAAAKARYYFKIVEVNEEQQTVWLSIQPRKARDRANWKSAQVILDTRTYLPKYVQLVDPAGTKETIFKFEEIKVNKKGNVFFDIFKGDPFHPRLAGIQVKDFKPQGIVPNLIGLHWKVAKENLTKAGFNTKKMIQSNLIRFKRGEVANREELVHIVYAQNPKPRSVLMEGDKIELTLYTKPKQTAAR